MIMIQNSDGRIPYELVYQALKYLKIGTCPAPQKLLAYIEKIQFSIEMSKVSLALHPEELVNTSGQVLFSSPVYSRT